MAMVHIARGAMERAEQIVVREGTVVQDRQIGRRQRYPARGLHWLLGLVRLARADAHEASAQFEREIETSSGQLYGAEFAMNAFDGLGFVRLGSGQHDEAIAAFRQALERYPEHARSRLGVAVALRAQGHKADADAESAAARRAAAELRRGGRGTEALMAEAFEHAVFDRRDQAVATLERMLAEADLPFAGWIIPIRSSASWLAGFCASRHG
jgi:tetratricopeptide (TPR) repeat protein